MRWKNMLFIILNDFKEIPVLKGDPEQRNKDARRELPYKRKELAYTELSLFPIKQKNCF